MYGWMIMILKPTPEVTSLEQAHRPGQWCSKTTKLQDQDHLYFQDQDRSGQDHFFKTKTAFLKTNKLLTQDHWRSQKFWLREA